MAHRLAATREHGHQEPYYAISVTEAPDGLPLHVDAGNDPQANSYIIALGKYEQGQLWVHHPRGNARTP
eukprot:3285545-Amphidinium_carterae.1